MMRSMYAGVSGLKAHQTKMDVIGNNIANVNTTGFKGSRVTFKEMFNQTLRSAQAPSGTNGGINPQQVGLGVGIGSIDVNHKQGNLQPTNIPTDLAIEGNGYFIVNDGTQQKNFYTRAGAFRLDDNGYLVSPDGYKLQGYSANESGQIGDNIGDIRIASDSTSDPKATSTVKFGGNFDSRTDNGVTFSSTVNVFDSLGKSHTVGLDFTRNIATNLTGSTTVNSNTFTIKQALADPNMDGNQIAFVNTNPSGEEISVDYTGGMITVSGDLNNSDLTVSQLEDKVNQVLSDSGLSTSLIFDYAGGNDTVVDQTFAGQNIALGAPKFGTTEVFAYQDVNSPDPALNGLKLNFVQQDDASLDASNVTYRDGEIFISANWNGAPGGGVQPDATLVNNNLEAFINGALAENDIDGEIKLKINNFTAADLADQDLTMSTTNHWNWQVTDISDAVEGSVSGSGGLTVDGNLDLSTNGLVFDSEGKLLPGANSTIQFNPVEAGASVQTMDIIFNDEANPLKQVAANSTVDGYYADGYEMGGLDSFYINQAGEFIGEFSNGINRRLGQLILARFGNQTGLAKQGDTLFASSENSGTVTRMTPGSNGIGKIVSGSLEMSNIDLAKEFTEMITAQRGFQANSKIITTSDQMLQDLVNLKR